MQAIKAILKFMVGSFLLLGLSLWLWVTSSSVNGWQTWLFRAAHQVAYVQDEAAGSRTVAFILRPRENVSHAVKSCIRSFDKMLLQDGTLVHCIAYLSFQGAELSRQQPQLICEAGRAIQMPYGSAANAQLLLNASSPCKVQPNYLPEYVRPFVAVKESL